ncbi:MAG: hypothetical protein A2X22_07065 [Bacteroidetes bacterium GWF2_49_14]|nr:MAG: hypothetical protein A2X22_07065 [Bacteroidetes bacterium GWF2_49_14]
MKRVGLLIVFLILTTIIAEAQIVDRRIYEGNEPFAFVNGSKPGMPVWDSNIKAFVPQANDTRSILVLDQTFSVPPGQEYLIENKIVYIRPTARADIIIDGTLKIRNSFLSWQQTEHQQTNLRVRRDGVLDIKDSYAFRANQYWLNWDYENGSTLIFDNFVGNAWTAMDGSVNYTSKNFSTVRLTLLSHVFNSNVTITDAHHLWLELYPPENSVFDISFPEKRKWIDWTLNGIWNNTTINATTSYIYERDLGITNGIKATVRDTPDGFGLGWAFYHYGGPLDFITCELSGLGDPVKTTHKFYADTTWQVAANNSSLHLINSTLFKSWPVTWGQVHLIVRNSNLADPRIFSGSGTYEIYNSTIDHFAAYAGTKAYLENCRISTDIEIKDNNTVVYGYNVTKKDSNDFSIMEVNGGRYQVLSTPGIPWPYLYLSTNILTVEAAANSTATCAIKSNTSWSAASDQSWLTLNCGTGINDTTLTLTAAANPTVFKRSAIVTITVTDVSFQRLMVTQEAGVSGMNETTFDLISIFPNPVTFDLTVENLNENAVISIYDSNGRLLIHKIAEASIQKLDLSHLTPGVYTINVADTKGIRINRFLKQ